MEDNYRKSENKYVKGAILIGLSVAGYFALKWLLDFSDPRTQKIEYDGKFKKRGVKE
jgi:hypothetical protein